MTAAVQEASLRGQIEATLDIIKAETDQLDVVRNQFDVGAAARTDVLTQQSEVATAQATLPPLQKQLEQQHHVLLALIGRFPNDGAARVVSRSRSLQLPTHLPVSLPSQLVEQRPDVRAAEAQLHQASAQIGVAIAARLPQFNLTGEYGTAALTHGMLFTPSTIVWSLAAASGTQPIFHGFTLLHQQRAAEAGYDMADAQYSNTVLAAFQNVADALRALQLDAATLKAQQRRAAGRIRHARSRARTVPAWRHHLCDLCSTRSAATSRPGLPWCRRKPRATPTPPPCSRRSAAAGGTASTWCRIRTVPTKRHLVERATELVTGTHATTELNQ